MGGKGEVARIAGASSGIMPQSQHYNAQQAHMMMQQYHFLQMMQQQHQAWPAAIGLVDIIFASQTLGLLGQAYV